MNNEDIVNMFPFRWRQRSHSLDHNTTQVSPRTLLALIWLSRLRAAVVLQLS